jgi:hypothetical protein
MRLCAKIKPPGDGKGEFRMAELNLFYLPLIVPSHGKHHHCYNLDFKNISLPEPIPIMADIQISPKTLTRTFTGVPILTDPSARVSPLQVTLTITGPWPKVQGLKAEDLKARVDTRNLNPGRHRLDISVELPGG